MKKAKQLRKETSSDPGADRVVATRLPVGLMRRLDDIAAAANVTRSQLVLMQIKKIIDDKPGGLLDVENEIARRWSSLGRQKQLLCATIGIETAIDDLNNFCRYSLAYIDRPDLDTYLGRRRLL